MEKHGVPHVLAIVPGSVNRAIRRKNKDGTVIYGTNRILGLWINHKYDNAITRIREKRAYRKLAKA